MNAAERSPAMTPKAGGAGDAVASMSSRTGFSLS